MTPFELVEPGSLAEALALLDPDDPDVRPIAGGTALMLMMKSGLYRPQRLVSLRALGPAFTGIAVTSEGGLAIGAMVRLAEVERSAAVRQAAPVLIALGASVRAVGPGGERVISIEALCTGYMTTVLGNDELIAGLDVPPQAGRRAAYAKITARSADDWPALGIAVSVGASDVRIAIGAATETAMRLPQTEALLAGRRIDDALLREAGKCAAAEAPVVGDLHGSAAYKRVLVEVHLRRALQKALAS
jgi:carbon-monoxide dehydrogenase medium subunit